MKISEETGLNRCLKALIFQRIQKLNSFQKGTREKVQLVPCYEQGSRGVSFR